MSGFIAIVGRPNVGKSALFNRIAGRRIAIVHDQPGVTRDRVTAEIEWQGRPLTLADTGGIGLVRGEKAHDVITSAALEQVQLAIGAADVILFVVNAQEGVVPLDQEVARQLRHSGKPVLLVVNKVDHSGVELQAAEFVRLGFEKLHSVTAIHGRGIDDLMAEAVKFLPPFEPGAEGEPASEPALKLAIVGRPNVGKSSIINTLTRSERVIVSPIPGTTRDSVDVPLEIESNGIRQRYLLIDTAGMRKARRIDDSIEFFSVQRSENSIERCDICILVLDAESGILEQDKKVADKIVEHHKACIVVVNKWDLVADNVAKAREDYVALPKSRRPGAEKPLTTLGEFGQWVQERLFFLDYAPVIFTSAKDGFNLDRLLEAVRYVASQLQQSIPTSLLNRTLHDAVERRQPVSSAGHRLKFFYATQVRKAPPTFLLFVNRDDLFSDQYKKYLSDEIRKAHGYEGCPLLLVPKPRPKTVESIRKTRPKTSKNKPNFRKNTTPRGKFRRKSH